MSETNIEIVDLTSPLNEYEDLIPSSPSFSPHPPILPSPTLSELVDLHDTIRQELAAESESMNGGQIAEVHSMNGYLNVSIFYFLFYLIYNLLYIFSLITKAHYALKTVHIFSIMHCLETSLCV